MLVNPAMVDAAMRCADNQNLLISEANMAKLITAALDTFEAREASVYRAISDELRRARAKHPTSRVTNTAMVEEVGEVAKALMDEAGFRVREEAVQVAAMAVRLLLDGDEYMQAFRDDVGLDDFRWSADDV